MPAIAFAQGMYQHYNNKYDAACNANYFAAMKLCYSSFLTINRVL